MTITHTNGIQKVTFKWNDEMTECDFLGQGVEDDTIQEMVDSKCHEGKEFNGWTLNIEL